MNDKLKFWLVMLPILAIAASIGGVAEYLRLG